MALSAATIWEIRSAGSDSSGGGFVSGASGTDRSQADAAFASGVNLTVDSATNTDVAPDGYSPVAADVGNLIQITTTGTGAAFSTGFYQIASIQAGKWRLDRSPAAVNSAGATWAMGGALASPGKAAGAVVAGNWVYLKAGTYTVTSSTGNIAGGRVNPAAGGSAPTAIMRWIGYQTTRGDNGTRPIIRAGVNMASTPLLRSGASYMAFENLEVDGNVPSFSGTRGIEAGSISTYILNCIVRNCDSRGLNFAASGIYVERTQVTGCTTQAAVTATGNAVIFFACEIYGNTAGGVEVQGGMTFVDCLFYGNTGASLDGVVIDAGLNNIATFIGCVFQGNGRHGLNVNLSSGGMVVQAVNCIFYGNGGRGVALPNAVAGLRLTNCAFGNNTSGAYDATLVTANYVTGTVTLTADPFANVAGNNFALNSTAGGGAACRAAGIPGAFPRGTTTGYADIGVQHQDAGGGGGSVIGSSIVRPARGAKV